MTVIGMKFNQAVEKKVACDVTFPLGPLRPPPTSKLHMTTRNFLLDGSDRTHSEVPHLLTPQSQAKPHHGVMVTVHIHFVMSGAKYHVRSETHL